MRCKFLQVVFLLLLTATTLSAQKLWLEPKKFILQKGESVVLNVASDKNFSGERWTWRDHKIKEFTQHALSGTTNLLPKLSKGEVSNITLPAVQDGTQLISMLGENGFVELDADTFHQRLQEDGQEDLISSLQKNNEWDKGARLNYARSAKLLFQVGTVSGSVFRKAVGHPLEIIPIVNPYLAKTGDELTFRVLFNGQPVPYAMVQIWNRKTDRVFVQKLYTEKDGIVRTPFIGTGAWMMSVVRMVKSSTTDADWQSYEATLVFGFE